MNRALSTTELYYVVCSEYDLGPNKAVLNKCVVTCSGARRSCRAASGAPCQRHVDFLD